MNKETLNYYKIIRDELENTVFDLFNYINQNYHDILKFDDGYSLYHDYYVADETISIEYIDSRLLDANDLFYHDYINIPIDDFCNNPKEWADKWATKLRKKKLKQEKQEQLNKEKEERNLYEQLKQKYEKNNN